MNKKYIAAAIAGLTLVPAFAFAQSSDLQLQVQTLTSQIQALQLQLKTLLASSTMEWKMNASTTKERMMPPGQMGKQACILLDRNLRVGAQGDDVKKLQEMLAQDPDTGFNAKATGFFGPMTARAMVKFQTRMGIASSSDGSVGPMTRGFFQRACGNGLGMGEDEHMKAATVRGTITAVAASSITVKIDDNKSRTVHVSASTTIMVVANATSTPAVGSMANLTVGTAVMAEGAPNEDGSLTARHIKVGALPPMPMMQIRGQGQGQGQGGMMY